VYFIFCTLTEINLIYLNVWFGVRCVGLPFFSTLHIQDIYYSIVFIIIIIIVFI